MTEFLVRHFVKDYEAVEKSAVRTAYGVLASMVGIVCNVFLFLVKFIVGLLLHSVSVTADAFNNLSDAASSIISFIGNSFVFMVYKISIIFERFNHIFNIYFQR